jgi:hypothetical protein
VSPHEIERCRVSVTRSDLGEKLITEEEPVDEVRATSSTAFFRPGDIVRLRPGVRPSHWVGALESRVCDTSTGGMR